MSRYLLVWKSKYKPFSIRKIAIGVGSTHTGFRNSAVALCESLQLNFIKKDCIKFDLYINSDRIEDIFGWEEVVDFVSRKGCSGCYIEIAIDILEKNLKPGQIWIIRSGNKIYDLGPALECKLAIDKKKRISLWELRFSELDLIDLNNLNG